MLGLHYVLRHYQHKVQIFLNFWHICQSFSWLTSLLKLDKYRDISSSGWDNFLIFLDIFLGCWYTCYKWFWFSYMTVSLFVCLLPYQTYTKGNLQFQMIFYGRIPGMFVHLLQIIMNFLCVCQSVIWLTFWLKSYKYTDISSSGWDIFMEFLEIFLKCWFTGSK